MVTKKSNVLYPSTWRSHFSQNLNMPPVLNHWNPEKRMQQVEALWTVSGYLPCNGENFQVEFNSSATVLPPMAIYVCETWKNSSHCPQAGRIPPAVSQMHSPHHDKKKPQAFCHCVWVLHQTVRSHSAALGTMPSKNCTDVDATQCTLKER